VRDGVAEISNKKLSVTTKRGVKYKIMEPQKQTWKEKLSEEEYRVMREKGTEAPFSGEYVSTKEKGMYLCKGCGAKLFSSETKFDSGTGWPSFTNPANLENILLTPDDSHGMHRTEVSCRQCGAHLGHVFDDGPGEQGQRYCINSVCLSLEKDGSN
jgi:peptide-methionine (R)-S-oxide reductase